MPRIQPTTDIFDYPSHQSEASMQTTTSISPPYITKPIHALSISLAETQKNPAMAMMRKLIPKRQKVSSSESLSSSSSSYTRLNSDGKVPKGYVPVLVGADQGVMERFLIPTRFIAHPTIVSFLESSADEFGYRQEGVLRIPGDPDCFREIIRSLV